MNDIIYTSNTSIPWDTQSAFKLTHYNVNQENHMIFAYLKTFVQNENLHLCSFCFKQNPTGKKDLQLSLNLNPENSKSYLHIEYGIDGIDSVFLIAENETVIINNNLIDVYPFLGDDEQGHYWAFEIIIKKDFIQNYFSTSLVESSSIAFNLHQIYNDSDDFSSIIKTKENSFKEKMNNQKQVLIFNY